MGEWETRKLKSEFVWFNSLILFFVIFISSIFFSRFSYAVFFFFNEIHKSHKQKVQNVWEFVTASAEVNNKYMSNQRYHHRLTNDVGIVYLFCNNHKLYKILLTRWTFSYFSRFFFSSACLWFWTNKNAHNLSHQHPMNGTRYKGIYNRA